MSGTIRMTRVSDRLSLTLGQVKQNLQVYHDQDDELIRDMIEAAIALLENTYKICIYRKMCKMYFSDFEQKLELKRANNCDLLKLEYYDQRTLIETFPIEGLRQTQDMPNFEYLEPRNGKWPKHDKFVGDVVVTYSAGYLPSDDMPSCIIQAIKLLVGDWFAKRSDSQEKAQYELVHGVSALMREYNRV